MRHTVLNKTKNGNGEYVRETTTRPKEQITAEGHQWVFNAAEISANRDGLQLAPTQKREPVQ